MLPCRKKEHWHGTMSPVAQTTGLSATSTTTARSTTCFLCFRAIISEFNNNNQNKNLGLSIGNSYGTHIVGIVTSQYHHDTLSPSKMLRPIGKRGFQLCQLPPMLPLHPWCWRKPHMWLLPMGSTPAALMLMLDIASLEDTPPNGNADSRDSLNPAMRRILDSHWIEGLIPSFLYGKVLIQQLN